MQGHLVLIDGDAESEVRELVAQVCGASEASGLGSATGVRGADVWTKVEELQAAHPRVPLVSFAITKPPGFTVLSDLGGVLVDEGERLARLSLRSNQRVISAVFSDDQPALRWWHSGGVRRTIEQTPTQCLRSGDPLPIEAAFGAADRFSSDDLMMLLQSLGIDLTELNRGGKYDIWCF